MSNLNNRFLRKGSAPARLVDSSIPVRYYCSTKTENDATHKKDDKISQDDSRNPPNSIFRPGRAGYRDAHSTRFNTRVNSNTNTKFSYIRKGSVPARLVHPSVPVEGAQHQDWMTRTDSIFPQKNERRDLEGNTSVGAEDAEATPKPLAKTEEFGKVDIGTGLCKEKMTHVRSVFSLKFLPVFFLHLSMILLLAGAATHLYYSPFFTNLPWSLPHISEENIIVFGDNVIEVAENPSSNVPSETDSPDPIVRELSSKAKQASDLEIEIAWESQHVHEIEESLGEKFANHGVFSVQELNKQNRALEDRVHHLMEMEKENALEKEGGRGLGSYPETDSSEPIEPKALSSESKQASDLEIEIAWESQHVHEIEESIGGKFANQAMFSAHELAKQNRALEDRVHHLMEMERELE